MTDQERDALTKLKAKAGPAGWVCLSEYLMPDDRRNWCAVFVSGAHVKGSPYVSTTADTVQDAIDRATCPQCGGILWHSEEGCAGHCSACEQRGQ